MRNPRLALLVVLASCGAGRHVLGDPSAVTTASLAPGASSTPRVGIGARHRQRRIEKSTFARPRSTHDAVLDLPAGGYDANTSARYPTVYLLHGGGGTSASGRPMASSTPPIA